MLFIEHVHRVAVGARRSRPVRGAGGALHDTIKQTAMEFDELRAAGPTTDSWRSWLH